MRSDLMKKNYIAVFDVNLNTSAHFRQFVCAHVRTQKDSGKYGTRIATELLDVDEEADLPRGHLPCALLQAILSCWPIVAVSIWLQLPSALTRHTTWQLPSKSYSHTWSLCMDTAK